MAAPYLIGIDVGTSSAKAVLIDATGQVLATAAPEYPFQTPKPLWAEADPADWWAATRKAIPAVIEQAGIDGRDVAGIGLTGQMHGLVLLDEAGDVLRPCIMWNDQRTARQCAAITEAIGAGQVLEITGNPVLPGFTAPKIAWVRDNEPEVYAQAARVLLPKDYIRYKMTGAFATDVSDASGMALLDVAKRQWSDTMLDGCGIPKAWMADVLESAEVSGTVSEAVADDLGLRAGIPVAAGGGDQAAQAVGCGIVREGVVSATFGTSGVVFAHSKQYRVEPQGRLHAFCAAVPGEWHLMGVMLSAAGSFQWYRNTLAGEEMAEAKATGKDAYDLLTAAAAEVPAGSEGLFFLPYLSGERTPHPDPNAKGAFVGLSLRHGKAHLTRAVLEGVTYGMRDSLELMRELGIAPETIIASGGGAKSPFWRQMMADVFGCRIQLVNATEGAAFGAALLGGVAAELFADVPAAVDATIQVTGETRVDAGTRAVYDQFYPEYRALYPALKDRFAAVADLQAE
ncbi:MAG: xylulokinase [Opitutales bacterium]